MSDKSNNDFYKWDKDGLVKTKIESNRNLDWYRNRYRRNLTISLIMVLLSFVFSVSSSYIIKEKNESSRIYLTSISGKIINFRLTEENRQKINRTINKLSKGN